MSGVEGSSWAVLEQRRREQERRAEAPPAPSDAYVTLAVPRGLAEAFLAETQAGEPTRTMHQLARLLMVAVESKGVRDEPDRSRPAGR